MDSIKGAQELALLEQVGPRQYRLRAFPIPPRPRLRDREQIQPAPRLQLWLTYRVLAHDGAWEGEQIVPMQWLLDATTVRASDSYLLPGKAMAPQPFGYGYLLWLLPGARRQFALVGAFGQRICIDPVSKLVMVQTAVENTPEVWRLWSAAVEQFGDA